MVFTLFMFAAPKNTADAIEYVLSALLHSNSRHRVTEELMKKIEAVDNQELLHLLGHVVTTAEQNIQANTRQEDPDWFKGMNIVLYNPEAFSFIWHVLVVHRFFFKILL